MGDLVKQLRDRERFVTEGPRYLQQMCEQAATEIDRLRDELAATNALMKELAKGRLEAAADTAARHMAELAEARRAREALRKELAEAKVEIDKMEWDLIARDKATAVMLESRNAALKAANASIAELETQVERGKSHVDAMNYEGTEIMKGLLARAERAEASHEQQVIVAANYAGRAESAEADIKIFSDALGRAEAERDAMREALRRLAVRQHVRMTEGGGTVPNGHSCVLCRSEWAQGEVEHHQSNCVLSRAALNPSPEGP